MSNVASSRLDRRRHTDHSTRNRRVPSLRLHKASGQAYFPCDVHQDIFAPAFVDMMHGPNPPTAVVFEYYQWAKAFLNDPRFADLRVPDHVSLATIGPTRKIPSVSWCPPMTSADIDYQRTAQCLVEALQRVLAGEMDAPSIQLRLKMTLTDSIGRVPDG